MKKNQTLQISLANYSNMFLVSILLFVTIITPVEVFLRSVDPDNSPHRVTLLNPLLDTRYAPVINKLNDFKTLQQSEDYNCLLVGSSLAEYLDPELFAEQLRQQTGKEVNCFNFALMDASASSVATLLSLLVTEYEFDLVVWGMQAHHFFSAPNSNEHRFSESPWVQYALGDFKIKGWMYEHSYFFRALSIYLPLLYFSDSLADPTTLARSERDQKLIKTHRSNGYDAILGYKDSAPLLDPNDTVIIDYLPSLEETSVADWDAITRVGQLAHNYDFDLVLVEFPAVRITPAAMALMDEVAIHARQRGIPYLAAGEIQLPVTAYCDTVSSTRHGFIHNHFHVSGTILFSQWLGNRIGDALETGELDNVNDSLWEPGRQMLEPNYIATLGLSDNHYQAYLRFRDAFELLPPNSSVLNPSPVSLDPIHLQSSLGLLLEWQAETSSNEWLAAFELMTLFDQMYYPASMDVSRPDQRLLNVWRTSADPSQLKALGVEYLLCRLEAQDTERVHCPAAVATHPGYTLIDEWHYAPMYDRYVLYRVEG